MKTFKQFLSEQKIHVNTAKEVPQEKLDLIADAVPKMMKALRLGDHPVRVSISRVLMMSGANGTGGANKSGGAYIDLGEKFVKKASTAELLDTVAHELIHVWQGLTGLFDSSDTYDWYFDGKKYSSGRPWVKSPWEWQAEANAWPLVVKAGLADGLTRPSKGGDHQTARIKGKQEGLLIPHLS